MATPRTVLVVNPQSQSGALGRRWPDLSRRIRRELGSFEELRTAAPGDATRLTREALQSGADLVVAIGGDGTINEVTNGFFDGTRAIAPEAALGILPFGTGGDFRKTIHVPKDLDQSSRILSKRITKSIDVGHLQYTTDDGRQESCVFANIASFGIGGLVDDYVNQSSKRLGGRLSFLLASARATFKYENQRVRLVFDDDATKPVETTIYAVAVANGRYFGGGMKIAPDAELDDGQFDVVALGDFTLGEKVLNSRHIYSGAHLKLDKVSHRRARVVRAEPMSAEPVRLDMDGETPGRLPATFTLLPAALKLVVPGPAS